MRANIHNNKKKRDNYGSFNVAKAVITTVLFSANRYERKDFASLTLDHDQYDSVLQ